MVLIRCPFYLPAGARSIRKQRRTYLLSRFKRRRRYRETLVTRQYYNVMWYVHAIFARQKMYDFHDTFVQSCRLFVEKKQNKTPNVFSTIIRINQTRTSYETKMYLSVSIKLLTFYFFYFFHSHLIRRCLIKYLMWARCRYTCTGRVRAYIKSWNAFSETITRARKIHTRAHVEECTLRLAAETLSQVQITSRLLYDAVQRYYTCIRTALKTEYVH